MDCGVDGADELGAEPLAELDDVQVDQRTRSKQDNITAPTTATCMAFPTWFTEECLDRVEGAPRPLENEHFDMVDL